MYPLILLCEESPPLVTLQVASKSPSSSLACLQPLQDGLQAMARHSPPSQVLMSDIDVEANEVKINGNHLVADAVTEMTSIEAGKDLLIDQPAAPSFS